MRCLILGSGGREHALALALLRDPTVSEVIVAPGNQGMELTEKIRSMGHAKAMSVAELAQLAKDEHVDLTLIGSEEYAFMGLADYWISQGMPIIGPTQNASALELSKIFSKNILSEAHVPTSEWCSFDQYESLENWAKQLPSEQLEQWVLKADGPCLGKGVFLPTNIQQLKEALDFFKTLGPRAKFLAEKKLHGVEISAFALINSGKITYIGDATDYKRLRDFDQGPNTGGMGAIAPSPFLNFSERKHVINHIFTPVVSTLQDHGITYEGFLFAGLLKTSKHIYVLEFNVRHH